MRSSYSDTDVTLLLKDITGMVKPQPTEEREALIQSGRHYSEMLPLEYTPTEAYMQTYREALYNCADAVADAIESLSDKIIQKKGKSVVLVSLARAGIPIGVLIKRCIKWRYSVDVFHYSISIIRGKGIDKNAVNYILERHSANDVLFVDGWIGKGAILKELEGEIRQFKGLSSELAVVADPAGMTDLCGTHEDLLIPSSCLNCTVSGLISRTFLRDDIIKENDFHGAAYYGSLKEEDLSYEFIHEIESKFKKDYKVSDVVLKHSGIQEVRKIAEEFAIPDINLIKPGIGEATRVLLRRVPWKVLVREDCREDRSLRHIIRLAEEKNVEIAYYPLTNYKACGIIKNMADA